MLPEALTKHQIVILGNRKAAKSTVALGTSWNQRPEKWTLAQGAITSVKEQAVANTLIPQAFDLAEKNGRTLGFLHQLNDITPNKVIGSFPTRAAYDEARVKHDNVKSWHVVIPKQPAVSKKISTRKPKNPNPNAAQYTIKKFRSVNDPGFVEAAFDPTVVATLNEKFSPELVENLFRVLNASTKLEAKPIPRIRNIEVNLSDKSIKSSGYITEKESAEGYLLEDESLVQANDKEALTAKIQRVAKDTITKGSDAVIRVKLDHVPTQNELFLIMDLRNEVYKIVTKPGFGARFKFVVTLPPSCEQGLTKEASSEKLSALHNYGPDGQIGVGCLVAAADKPILETINESGLITTRDKGKVGIFCCDDNQYEQAVFEKLAKKSQH